MSQIYLPEKVYDLQRNRAKKKPDVFAKRTLIYTKDVMVRTGGGTVRREEAQSATPPPQLLHRAGHDAASASAAASSSTAAAVAAEASVLSVGENKGPLILFFNLGVIQI